MLTLNLALYECRYVPSFYVGMGTKIKEAGIAYCEKYHLLCKAALDEASVLPVV